MKKAFGKYFPKALKASLSKNCVLRLLCRRGFFSKEEVEKMLSYNQSGFSLDAKVRIESWVKDGLERLIRYCARPPFASENLRWNGRLAFSTAFQNLLALGSYRCNSSR
jgi:hypothetical protein